MLKKMNPTKTVSWQNLKNHYKKIKNIHMKERFKTDPERFRKFSTQFNDILVDYSKNRITNETLQIFHELAIEIDLRDAIEKMFTGDKINETENRAVLHTALRNRGNTPVYVDGKDVMPEVNDVLKKIESSHTK
jgi:glucose-6-phosphate isomerase